MKKIIAGFALLTCGASQSGVYINEDGMGDVVLLPYYTVRNSNNSLITINNHSDTHGKAIQMVIREGKNGNNVLSFNMYLQPNDTWTGALIEDESTVVDHNGEPSASLISQDGSCTPFLSVSQELLPFGFEENEELDSTMERAQEGFIEIYEMAEFDPDSEQLDFTDCDEVQQAWLGVWETTDVNFQMSEPQGEISAQMAVVNVGDGTSFSYKGTAFADFFEEGVTMHSSPGVDLTLNDGVKSSQMFSKNGLVETTWDDGFAAISSLLIKNKVEFDFSIEQFVNGQAETVVTFPTKRFYIDGQSAQVPFAAVYDEVDGACESVQVNVVDGEGQDLSLNGQPSDLCWSTNVISMKKNANNSSQIFTSQYEKSIITSGQQETGSVSLGFNHSVDGQATQGGNDWVFNGLPVSGFMVQRFTNANAQPGLMAQYSSHYDLIKHKSIEQ